MAAIVRSRLSSIILKRSRRFSSQVYTNPPRESSYSSSFHDDFRPSSSLGEDFRSPPPSQQHPPPPSGTEKKPWNFLKYSLVAGLTGSVAAVGYGTYGIGILY